MMIVVLHVLGVGVWLGCAGAETIVEVIGRRDEKLRDAAFRLHYWIDIVVEVPALFLALGTGIWLASQGPIEGWTLVKVIAGSVAIGANLVACLAVVLRYRELAAGDAPGVRARDRLFGAMVAVALPATIVALAVALAV